MPVEIWVIALLCVLLVVQNVYYMRQIQKLVDKAMSRSYNEYVSATKPAPPRITIPTQPQEDLGVLGGF